MLNTLFFMHYPSTDRLDEDLSAEDKSNLCFANLASGQMVIVGNGIVVIDIDFSWKCMVTGLSFHCVQIF